LELIPAVLDSNLDKNFSEAGMMEGIVLVMLRLTKMVQRQNTQGVAMTERTRRGKMRMLEEMECCKLQATTQPVHVFYIAGHQNLGTHLCHVTLTLSHIVLHTY
jgi:hypothetical protein